MSLVLRQLISCSHFQLYRVNLLDDSGIKVRKSTKIYLSCFFSFVILIRVQRGISKAFRSTSFKSISHSYKVFAENVQRCDDKQSDKQKILASNLLMVWIP